MQSVCWYHRPSICPSILYIHSVCLVVHLFSLSICLSVYSDPAYQSICHFKGQFDPTDRNDRTSEIIMNKYSSQTVIRLCAVHPSIQSIRPAGNLICLSICLFSPFVHQMDGQTSFFFSESSIIIRCRFFFLFIGQKPARWPANKCLNNCLQMMACSCAMSFNCVWL